MNQSKVRVLLQDPASLLSNELNTDDGALFADVSGQSVIPSRTSEHCVLAVKVDGTKHFKCSNNKRFDVRRFKCLYGDCKWAFSSNYKLQRHMEVHLGHKTYVCHVPDCGKTFSTVYNLRSHIKRHDSGDSETCPVSGCDAKFSTRLQRNNHVKDQHPTEKPYRCSYPSCGKSFAFNWNLVAHARCHRISSESLRCQFDGCGRQFDLPCRLKQHQRVHSSQRPYACPEPDCSWAFASASQLQRHQLRHTGRKQWVCPHEGCGKTFARSEHVRGHLSTHSDLRPYCCSEPACSAKFKNSSSLFVHRRRHKNKSLEVEDCSGVTDVAAYASVIASSVRQPTDSEMLTSHGITFRDLETGAFCLQTQLLQDDPPSLEICDFDDNGATVSTETSADCFADLDIDDTVYTATTINLHDLE